MRDNYTLRWKDMYTRAKSEKPACENAKDQRILGWLMALEQGSFKTAKEFCGGDPYLNQGEEW